MAITSLSFVFVFLPVAALLYYLTPSRRKSTVLFGLSLLFYGMLDLWGLGLMLLSLTIDYTIVRVIHRLGREDPRARKLCTVCVIKSVAMLVASSAINQIVHLAIPLGLYIYTLTSLGYVVDFYRGEVEFEPDPLLFGSMCCFFGKLYCGPLVEYNEIADQLRTPNVSLSQIGEGILLLVQGLFKKLILADNILAVYYKLAEAARTEPTVVGSWVLVFSAVFAVYFTLSGYCDIAVGVAGLFGFTLPQNFAYPLQSRTVTDFFLRFNITVTRYIRKYVYRFLGYDTGGHLSNALNLMLTAMLAAIWFGLRLGTLLWGLFLGAFMVAEALWGQKFFNKIPPFFLRMYAFSVVLLSFSIFSGNSVVSSWQQFVTMIGLGGHPFINDIVQHLLLSNGVLILLCLLLSTSVCEIIGRWIAQGYPRLAKMVSAVATLVMFVVTVSFMI